MGYANKEYTTEPGKGDDKRLINLITSMDDSAKCWRMMRGINEPLTEREIHEAYRERYGVEIARSRIMHLFVRGWIEHACMKPGGFGRPARAFRHRDTRKKVKQLTLNQRATEVKRKLVRLDRMAKKGRDLPDVISMALQFKAISEEVRALRKFLGETRKSRNVVVEEGDA